MTDYERIEKVIRYLERHYLEQPSLVKLAGVAGLSEFHFHRLFTRWAGTTPKSFLKYLTANHAKSLLEDSRDLLGAAFDSGLSGPSRLHDLFVSIEAMTPGEFKAKGAGVEIKYGFHLSPFGKCLIGTTERGVCYLAFVDEREQQAVDEMKRKWPNASLKSHKTEIAKIAKKIFGGRRSGKQIPVMLTGTPFQLKVWEALIRIPPGQVLSYSDIAKAIGSPNASRAVGTALGSNTVAYLIPCHRVIRETGEFGEYHWGTARKRAVLAWESAI
jgi:AraC family transcriptional regulator of adaptative response/methylated-DNA-[protein]-cysteine methyltransferase